VSNARSQPRLVAGPVGRHLWQLSAPMVVGLFALNSYSLADTYFVGQLGTLPLAAMTFTFPVSFTLIAIGLGVGIGASSVLARLLGAGEHDTVQRITTHALVLGAVLGLVVMVVGLNSIDYVFGKLGADSETLPLIREYMEVFYFGGFLLILPMVGNFAIRAVGDARMAAVILSISALFNIVLDPILIFGLFGFPALELRGAALATVFANGVTVVASAAILYTRESLIHPRHLHPRHLLDSWRRLLYVGLPAMASNLLPPVSIGIITYLVSAFGPARVAGFGVASRVEAIVMVVLFAVTASMGPFAGQNFGAGHLDRIRKFASSSDSFCLIYALVAALLLGLMGTPLSAMFSEQSEVVQTAALYLLVVPFSLGGFAVMLNAIAAFNGLGRPLPATLLTFMKLFLFYVPLAWLLSRLFGVIGIFAANATAHLAFGLLGFIWLRRTLSRLEAARAASSSESASPTLTR